MNTVYFNERARENLAHSRTEAARYGLEFVNPDLIFLGLLNDPGVKPGVVTGVLENLGVDREAARQSIESALAANPPLPTSAVDMPFTAESKELLHHAMTESRTLGHDYVGSEHMLLGLLRIGTCDSTKLLNAQGVHAHNTREEVLRLLHPE